MNYQPIYIVTGMMRTGTSATMKALEAGGMRASYVQARGGSREGLYELHEKDYSTPMFPLQYQGRLIKILNSGPANMAYNPGGYHIVCNIRNPAEIYPSYVSAFGSPKEGEKKEQAEIRCERIKLACQQYEVMVLNNIDRLLQRSDVLSLAVMAFREDLIRDPAGYFEHLAKIGWPIDYGAASTVIDARKNRFRRESLPDTGIASVNPDRIIDEFRQLQAASNFVAALPYYSTA